MLFKSLKLAAAICALASALYVQSAAAGAVSINELVENSAAYDGQEVTVQGEALDEALERGRYAWVNISDGSNAIGIWMTIDDARQILHYGSYKGKGDIIRVTGVFSRACPQHGGDVDIHCSRLEIVSRGQNVREDIPATKALAAGALAVLAALSFQYFFTKLRRRRAGP